MTEQKSIPIDPEFITDYDKKSVQILYSGKVGIPVYVGKQRYECYLQPVPFSIRSQWLATILETSELEELEGLHILERFDINLRVFTALWNYLNCADDNFLAELLDSLEPEEFLDLANYNKYFIIENEQYQDIFADVMSHKVTPENRAFFLENINVLLSGVKGAKDKKAFTLKIQGKDPYNRFTELFGM